MIEVRGHMAMTKPVTRAPVNQIGLTVPNTFPRHLRVCHHGPVIDWSRQFNHSRAICFLHYFLIIALCLF